jgi:hypothetical protein
MARGSLAPIYLQKERGHFIGIVNSIQRQIKAIKP